MVICARAVFAGVIKLCAVGQKLISSQSVEVVSGCLHLHVLRFLLYLSYLSLAGKGKAFTSCNLDGRTALTSSAIDSGERYSTQNPTRPSSILLWYNIPCTGRDMKSSSYS